MKRLGAFFLIVAISGGILFGQAQSNAADLIGVIRDETGGVLPGADITVRNVATGIARNTVTDDTGSYRVPLLPPGEYELRVALEGFTTQVLQGIVLTVGQSANLDVVLKVQSSETEVTVTSDAAIIEKQKTVQASTISQNEIQNLPINGRNFLDFALLTPGVTDNNSLVTESAVQAPTSGLSFGGRDQRSNYVTVDGADNIDAISNSVRSTLSQEAIQEFQINRNTFSAEFGRARGGVINIVSKSGTNTVHGTGFYFIRHNALDATNTFATSNPTEPEFKRHQFGGVVGGPIIKDRTFFFASYEGLRRDESLFVNFLDDLSIFEPTPSQSALFGFLASTGIPSLNFLSQAFVGTTAGALRTLPTNFPETLALLDRESGVFPFSADSDTFSIKVDHQVSNSNQMSLRFNINSNTNDNSSFGALEGVSNGVSFDSFDYSLVFSDTHIFTSTTLNDFKFQFSKRDYTVNTNDPNGPQVTIAGVAEFGREFFNPTGYEQFVYQATENLTLIRGNHTLKFGADLNILDFSGFAEVFLGGRFSFGERVPLGLVMDSLLGTGTAQGLITQLATPTAAGGLGRPDLIPNVLAPISSLQSFNFGLPISFLQGFGDPNTGFTYPQLALFVQDTWKLRENFTLNLGVRYDWDSRAETTNVVSTTAPFQFETAPVNDRNNVAPRFGFAWDPANNGKTVIRGGYGIFFQNYFQAIAFVSQVLSGQISQAFLPLTGLPGITPLTSADVWELVCPEGNCQNGISGQQALTELGLTPGSTPSVILPGAGDVVNPYSHQASLGFEQAFGRDFSLSLDYSFNRGVKLIRSRDINVLPVGFNLFAGRGMDPRFVQINQIETSGSSVYHSFSVSAKRRFSHNFSFNVAYTVGKSIDDTTDFITPLQPNNQAFLRGERSLSTFDQRQRLVVSGVFQSPRRAGSGQGFVGNFLADWVVAPIVTWQTGRPFNLLNGFDRNNDTHDETDRPLQSDGTQIGRNTGLGPGFFGTDLRISRKFRLPREETYFEFLFEAFNLFNNVNYSGVNQVVGNQQLANARVEGSSDIPANRPLGFTSAFDGRQIQFGFRFNF